MLLVASQGLICTVEAAAAAVGVRAPAWLRDRSGLRAVLTTLCLVPFSPLFMAPLRVGTPCVLEQMLLTLPKLRLELY